MDDWAVFAFDRLRERFPAKRLARVKRVIRKKTQQIKRRPMATEVIGALERLEVEREPAQLDAGLVERMTQADIDRAIQIELLIDELDREVEREIMRIRRSTALLLLD